MLYSGRLKKPREIGGVSTGSYCSKIKCTPAGESFRVMPWEQFSVEFPAYAGAVERLNQAIEQARFQYSEEANLKEFVRLARERLATQIEQGRQFGRIKQGETPAQGSGASGGRKPKASR
jgi:hypothetical protein